MQGKSSSADAGLRGRDLRRFLGCAGLAIVCLVVGIALIFLMGSRYQQEWAAVRPAGLTDQAWQEQRGLCEEAKMAPAECGTAPLAKIKSEAAMQREKARLELCAEDVSYGATEQAKKAVSGRLKAPGTAKWSDVRASQRGCDWRVTGNVDAQNAFGGTMRSEFDVRLRRASKDGWVPITIDIH